MRKYIITIAFLLIFTASMIGYPLAALSANDVSFIADTTLTVGNFTFTVVSGSVCDQMVVGTTTLQVTLSASSSVTIKSGDRYLFNDDANIGTDCGNPTYSQIVLPAYASSTTVTLTPSTDTCSTQSAGASTGAVGASGSTPAPAAPTKSTTTTGEVTITKSAGGKTTLTTAESTAVSADFPANAVSASTDVTIAFENKTNVVASRPIPSGKSIVGSYAYNFSAAAGSTAVTNFSENVTLTFTYTDSQIAGLNEDTLKIYYWDGTQWLHLATTINKANNTLTVTTNHFTYFVIMGESEAPSELASPEDYGLTEGDLIRAEGDFDIFIINQYGYKRLFLNPAIFEMYGHLGSWDDVKTVTPETRDAFITSSHYRYVSEDKVYHLEVTGEDTGMLQWIDMIAEDFLAQGGVADAIFTINKSELDWYPKGADKTSL